MNLAPSIRKRSVDQWAMCGGHERVSAPTASVKCLRLLETSLAFVLLVSFGPAVHAQEAVTDTGCTVHGFFHDTWSETSQFGRGLKAVPRGVVRPSNLKWELPILAATGVMIAKVDRPADNRIQSKSLQQTAGQWSNVGLGLELGSAALRMASDVANTIPICGTRDSRHSQQWERRAPQIWFSSSRSIASFLTHQTARESSGAAEGLFPPGIQQQVSRLLRWSLTAIPKISGSSGARMRSQPESVSHATRRKSITLRTS